MNITNLFSDEIMKSSVSGSDSRPIHKINIRSMLNTAHEAVYPNERHLTRQFKSGDTFAHTIFMNNIYSKHTSPHNSETDSRIQNLAKESYKYLSSDTLIDGGYFNYGKKKDTELFNNKNAITDGDANILMWNRHFPGTTVLESNEPALIYNRFACCFDINETFPTVFETLRHNLLVFIIELFRGTTEESHKLLLEIRMTKHFLSRAINNPIQYSGLCVISSRYPITGLLKKRLDYVKLNVGDKIIITADRKFSQSGTRNVIYINCFDIITKVKPHDYVLINNMIRLRVLEQSNISAMCEVICPGILKRGLAVEFPREYADFTQITLEEIEDIKYSISEKINCIILPTSNCDIYLQSIKEFLQSLDFNYCRLFATVYAIDVTSMEQAKLISENYDGLNLFIYKNFTENRHILQLTDNVKYLIEQFYFKKKPILVGQFFINNKLEHQSLIIHPDSQKHILYYPDKFVLKITQLKYYFVSSYFNIIDANKFSMKEFALDDLNYPLEDISESNLFARAVVKAAFESNAKCIILSSKSGRMAIKISHFRPNIPIIVLIENLNIVRYLSIYNNVWLVYYNGYNEYNTLTLSLKKMLCAIIYAISHNLLIEGQNIIYVYRTSPSTTYPNKMAVMAVSDTLLRNIAIKHH